VVNQPTGGRWGWARIGRGDPWESGSGLDEDYQPSATGGACARRRFGSGGRRWAWPTRRLRAPCGGCATSPPAPPSWPGCERPRTRPATLRRNAKIAAAHQGRPKPPHVIEALRQANLGRKASARTRHKMSEAQRRGQAIPIQRRAWPPEEDALLGVVPDAEVGRRTGRGEDAVRSRRARLLIPVPRAGGG
jgi:hypothetical protein